MQLPILPPVGSAPGEGQEKSKETCESVTTGQPNGGFQRVFGEMVPGARHKAKESKSDGPATDKKHSTTLEQKRAVPFDIAPDYATPFMDSTKMPEPVAVAQSSEGNASPSGASLIPTAQLTPLSTPSVEPDLVTTVADRGSQTDLGVEKMESGDQSKTESTLKTKFVEGAGPTSMGAVVATTKTGLATEAITVPTPGNGVGERAQMGPEVEKSMPPLLPEEQGRKNGVVTGTGAFSVKEFRDNGEKVAGETRAPMAHAPEAARRGQEAGVVSTPDRHIRASSLPTPVARQTVGRPVASVKSRTELPSGREGQPQTNAANTTKGPPSGAQQGTSAHFPVPDFPDGAPGDELAPAKNEHEASPTPQSFGRPRRSPGGIEARAISEAPHPKMPTPTPPSQNTEVAPPRAPMPVSGDEAAFAVSKPAAEPSQSRVPSAYIGALISGGQAGATPEGPRGLPDFSMPLAGLDPALSGLDESRRSESDYSVAEPRGASPISASAGSPGPIILHHEATRGVMIQIAQAALANHDRAVELRLHPEELGHVRMTFTTDHGGLTVAMTAERGETLDLLRRNIDMLGEELRRIGYGSVDFSFGSEHHASGGEAEPWPSNNASAARSEPALDQDRTEEPPSRSLQGLAPVGGGVDMRI